MHPVRLVVKLGENDAQAQKCPSLTLVGSWKTEKYQRSSQIFLLQLEISIYLLGSLGVTLFNRSSHCSMLTLKYVLKQSLYKCSSQMSLNPLNTEGFRNSHPQLLLVSSWMPGLCTKTVKGLVNVFKDIFQHVTT